MTQQRNRKGLAPRRRILRWLYLRVSTVLGLIFLLLGIICTYHNIYAVLWQGEDFGLKFRSFAGSACVAVVTVHPDFLLIDLMGAHAEAQDRRERVGYGLRHGPDDQGEWFKYTELIYFEDFAIPYSSAKGSATTQYDTIQFFIFPAWLFHASSVLILLPLFAVLISARRHRRRARAGQCPACGYDLTGNTSGICPECGSVIPQSSRPPSTKEASLDRQH